MLMSSRFSFVAQKGGCVSSWNYESYIRGRSTIPHRVAMLEKEGKINGEHFVVWVDVGERIYVKLSMLPLQLT